MKEEKKYKEMSAEERVNWLNDFTTFANAKFPVLKTIEGSWNAAQMKTFEEGLQLIKAFPKYRGFVNERLVWKDYSSSMGRLGRFLKNIKEEISRGFVMNGVDGEQVVYVPTANIEKKRGRPTREEAAAAAAAQEEIRLQEEQARLIAELNGATPMEKSVAREKNNEELLEEKRKVEEKTPNLFANFERAQAITSPVDMILSQSRPHLHQIAFLFSAALAVEVAGVRDIRTELSSCAERAKLLAEQGKSDKEISEYSLRAAQLTSRLEEIYRAVDRQLARLYILMPMDETLDGHRDAVVAHQISDADLIGILKPYYDKCKQEYPNYEKEVIAEFEANRPEVIAQKKAEAERKKEVAALRKYIMREDKKASETRVKGIEQRIERLKELGEDTSEMELILQKTIEAI